MKMLIRLTVLCVVSFLVFFTVNSCGERVASSGVPQNLNILPESTELLVTWDGVNKATSYNIYWSMGSDITKETGTKISGVESTEYIHAGLRNGTTYYYIVTGQIGETETVPSEVASGTPEFSGEKDFEISIPMSAPFGDMEFMILSDKDGYVYLIVQHSEDGLYEIRKYDSKGSLDKRFGENGIVTHSPDDDSCIVANFALNSKQDLIVACACGCGDGDCGDEGSFARIYRYLSSGKPDLAFGEEGFVDGDVGFYVRGVKIDSDDNIFIAGSTTEILNEHLFVAKYSDSGKKIWLFNAEDLSHETEGQSMLIDNKGDVIVVQDNGLADNIAEDGDERQYLIWKIKNDGSDFVNRFGNNGVLEPSGYKIGWPISVDSADGFLTNVNTGRNPLMGKAYILKFDSKGIQNRSFGNGSGRLDISKACSDEERSFNLMIGAIEEYGGMFIGSGVAADDDVEFSNLISYVCIFNDKGELDTSKFNSGYYYGPENSFAMGIEMDPLGRLLVGYQVLNSRGVINEVKVLRYK